MARDARPRRAGHRAGLPVCPIFAGTGLYLLITADSPKMRDLSRDGSYALHAQLGEQDLEFQIGGRVRIISDPR